MDLNAVSQGPLNNMSIANRPVLAAQSTPLATPTPQSRTLDASRRLNQAQAMQRHVNGALPPKRHANHQAAKDRRVYNHMQRGPPPRQQPANQHLETNLPKHLVELKVIVTNMPKNWTTWEIYEQFQQYGSIARIDIHEPQRTTSINASVFFTPIPDCQRLREANIVLQGARSGAHRRVGIAIPMQMPFVHRGKNGSKQEFPDLIRVPMSELHFGVMKAADTMLLLHTVNRQEPDSMELVLNLQRKALDLNFVVQQRPPSDNCDSNFKRTLKLRLNVSQLQTVYELSDAKNDQKSWVLSMSQPPMVYRKTENIKATHSGSAGYWTEWQTWFRQTEIDTDPNASGESMIQLQNEHAIVDIGRCLTYKLVFDEATANSDALRKLCQALEGHNVPIHTSNPIYFDGATDEVLWSWLDSPMTVLKQSPAMSDLDQMAELAFDLINLPFVVRYQLEVCISQGILHECNITKEFLKKLNKTEGHEIQFVTGILQKAVDLGERFFNPDEMFQRLSHKVCLAKEQIPAYCATIRSATITPTTVYFMTPMMETSNRVVRKYQQHEDRFLRVKFTDEKYKGRIQSHSDVTMDQVFTRVKRALTNGIHVAGRRYEFLAFGNSQFREHGAWFFAPIGDLTADKIRKDLGNFDHIKIVAKYASRIGQCFSTTKPTRLPVALEEIPDMHKKITIDGNLHTYCFTDGVGKISPFVAEMIARELNYASGPDKCPSTFQFRYEGCKGILVVDPTLKGRRIQVRPSQKKFPGSCHYGLEIVRVSQYSTSYLNVQLILVLSALGVGDDVFVGKMMQMLCDLEEAMHNEDKAMELLGKNIDFNRMTLQLGSAIFDGFMDKQDPFIISCLHLWRSWSLKYLKEKAKIYVDQGAFVFGCVDETGTLRGHYDTDKPDDHDVSKLPEIFLQIDKENKGEWRIVKGVCILMRNPSLHPGDIRVVRAVDVPALHHVRDCVVLPSTGDRDLANMCSGGDLDGDDYLVIWDQELIPTEWNHPPMDYKGPEVKTVENVTVDDMTSFFVTHMKHDVLGPIAMNHRYWADAELEGVKSSNCITLAGLHSAAVDFAKTGEPAIMPNELRVKRWPHWAELKNKPRHKVYHSKRVIGQLYDAVQRAAFEAAWFLPFDKRVLESYTLDQDMLQSAREAKELYDEGMRQIMAKYAIGNEFEVWTTFVMEHSDDIGDYKFAETIGEAAGALKEAHQKLCCERAGTNELQRDWEKLGPFVAAMYTVTAQEVGEAVEECERVQMKGGEWVPVKVPHFDNMPFMSFPWLFPTELGRIAKGGQKNLKPQVFNKPSLRPVKVFGEENLLLDEEDLVAVEDDGVIRQHQELFVSAPVLSSQQDLLTGDASQHDDDISLSPTPSLNPPTPGSSSYFDSGSIVPESSQLSEVILGDGNDGRNDTSNNNLPPCGDENTAIQV